MRFQLYGSGVSGVHCPRCETLASVAGGKPYCPTCGWNAEVAQQLVQENLKILKIGIGIVTILTVSALVLINVFGAKFDFPWPLLMLMIAGTWMLYSGFKELKKVSELNAIHSRIGENFAHSMGGRRVPAWSGPLPQKYTYLLTVSRPRAVRLSRQGKMDVVGASLVGVLLLWIGLLNVVEPIGGSRHWSFWFFNLLWVGGMLVFGIVMAAEFGKESARRRPLRDGEVTFTKITRKQSTGGKHPKSEIVYSYQDSSGNTYKGSAIDRKRTLYEEMTVPVFFNPVSPQDHVVECATIWEVLPPAIGS